MRPDQGGDTVSEGQAYGMLIAAGVGDEDRFRQVWAWTDEHLQRRDRLLAWRWADGAVVDSTPAADADLVAAGALALAGAALRRPPTLVADGTRARRGRARPARRWRSARAGARWPGRGRRRERVVNPSYFVVGLMSQL